MVVVGLLEERLEAEHETLVIGGKTSIRNRCVRDDEMKKYRLIMS
jgi:hypothetical protein